MIHIGIISGERVTTEFVNPPIPYRSFDYVAFRDPESTTRGYGPTREAAIADLIEQEDEDDMPTECRRCNGSGEIAVGTSAGMPYKGPGPVPDDARKVVGITCDKCGGMGYVP